MSHSYICVALLAPIYRYLSLFPPSTREKRIGTTTLCRKGGCYCHAILHPQGVTFPIFNTSRAFESSIFNRSHLSAPAYRAPRQSSDPTPCDMACIFFSIFAYTERRPTSYTRSYLILISLSHPHLIFSVPRPVLRLYF